MMSQGDEMRGTEVGISPIDMLADFKPTDDRIDQKLYQMIVDERDFQSDHDSDFSGFKSQRKKKRSNSDNMRLMLNGVNDKLLSPP